MFKTTKSQTMLVIIIGLVLYLLLMRAQGEVRSVSLGRIGDQGYIYLPVAGDQAVVVLRAGFPTVVPSNTPTPSNTPNPTQVSNTRTATAAYTASPTATGPTRTPTSTATAGPSPTPTVTPTPTFTPTQPLSYSAPPGRTAIQYKTLGMTQSAAFYTLNDKGYLLLANGTRGLQILDVSDPNFINEPASLLATVGLPNAESVLVFEKRAYIAGGEHDVYVVDIADPAKPVVVDIRHTTGEAYDLAVFAYETEQGRQARLYVADGRRGVVEMSLIPALYPDTEKGESYPRYTEPSDARGVWVTESGLMYVADGYRGVHVVDVYKYGALEEKGIFSTGGYAWDVAVRGEYVYVAAGYSGLVVMKISQEQGVFRLEIIATVDTPGAAHQVLLFHNDIFLADGEGGMRVFNIANPASPKLIDSYNMDWVEASLVPLLQSLVGGGEQTDNTNNTEGNVAIDAGICLVSWFIALLIFAAYVLPSRSIFGRMRILNLITHAWSGSHGSAHFIEDGKVISDRDKPGMHGPGASVLDAGSAGVLIQGHRGRQQVVGSRMTFTGKEDHLKTSVDLRMKELVVGPQPDENPFPLRQEGESRPAYRARQYRRRQTTGRTRDGVQMVPTLRVVYSYAEQAVQPDGRVLPFRPEEIAAMYASLHPDPDSVRRRGAAPLPPQALLELMVANVWKRYLPCFKLNQLFVLPAPGAAQPDTGLERVLNILRDHLTMRRVIELDSDGQPTGALVDSREFWGLALRGLRVHSITCEALHIPDEDAMRLGRDWREAWLAGAPTGGTPGSTGFELQALLDYADASIRLIKDQLNYPGYEPPLSDSLRLLLIGTLELTQPGSQERQRIQQLIQQVGGNP